MAKTQRIWLRMTYRCCGMEWTDEWPEAFGIECPDCKVVVEACTIVEIGARPPPAKRAGAAGHNQHPASTRAHRA